MLWVNWLSEIRRLLLQAWCQLLQQCFKFSDGHPEVRFEAAVVQFYLLNQAVEPGAPLRVNNGCTQIFCFIFLLLIKRSTNSSSLDVE